MNARSVLAMMLAPALLLGSSTTALAQTNATADDPAAQFGAQQLLTSAELSPDGKRIVYIGPGPGSTSQIGLIDIATSTVTHIGSADGEPMRMAYCGWSAADRVVCSQYGSLRQLGKMISYSRVFAVDVDGKNAKKLGLSDSDIQLSARQFDGYVLDWLDGKDGNVLMSRYYVPEASAGRLLARTKEGLGVDLIDTRTRKAKTVEPARPNVSYLSDGRGVVRVMSRQDIEREHFLSGDVTHLYRMPDDQEWHELGTNNADNNGMEPVAVDSGANVAYVLKYLDGRRALYRILLDGSLKTELAFAHPQVDVDNVVTIGRNGRVIGASYVTERPHVEYFDPSYRSLAESLSSAIPNLPLIAFVSASADENMLLMFASSDNNPGRFFLMDRAKNQLIPMMPVRPQLARTELAEVRSITYPAADGTPVPAYLTLPPGTDEPAGLPAIVMPHGGPASRDVWGFDWWAQYYAGRGFAVLQPNYRGSAGFGNSWFVINGFRSWPIAIGDIADGGRWLISQGIADPAKLAIVGWSYGGYAALQANVVDPNLFKAVVAVAPVTDLQLLKSEFAGFSNELLARDFIGEGPHVAAGSPARHAEVFKAPVMLFHGETDSNVDVAESREMDKALKRAGKSSELTIYPNLDHQLYDNEARTDMLRRSLEFLRKNLKL